eukprot:TRINITY_DN106881_c0_g1_i1.p1 TRINITY_DN106881_c0_g1~~TRINITY_DN106881_c0_g1_i1.p1  ORF type:complete len:642 (-),score=125.64 TRINITY_DN106881_c0_g1_i1:76-2001(-)
MNNFKYLLGAILWLVAALTCQELRTRYSTYKAAVDGISALQDGGVDLPELQSLLEGAEGFMQAFDVDKSGRLEVDEFRQLQRRLGKSLEKLLLFCTISVCVALCLVGISVMILRSADVESPLCNYETIKKLGQGSFGEVYKCRRKYDVGTEEYEISYAIKHIPVTSVTSANEALTEAVRLARCEHKHLIPIHEEFFHNRWAEMNFIERLFSSPYVICLVMDLCSGNLSRLIQDWAFEEQIIKILNAAPGLTKDEALDLLNDNDCDIQATLKSLDKASMKPLQLQRCKSAPWERPRPSGRLILDITNQVASGCAHLHGQGLVHLDLKPDNVFFSPGRQGDAILCQVGDLGLAMPDVKFSQEQLRRRSEMQSQRTKAEQTGRASLQRSLRTKSDEGRGWQTLRRAWQNGNLQKHGKISTESREWQKGDLVQIWSASQKQWFDGAIESIATEDCELDGRRVRKGTLLITSGEDSRLVPPHEAVQRLRKKAMERKWGPEVEFDGPAGTRGYIAPELYLDNEDVSEKCDTWSLGVILVDLCTSALGSDETAFGLLLDESGALDTEIQEEDYGDVARVAAHSRNAAGNAHAKAIAEGIKKRENKSTGRCLDFTSHRALLERALDMEPSTRPTCHELADDTAQLLSCH